MAFLVRKFSRAKWGDPVPATCSDIQADAVSLCLKTNDNSLSVWRIDDKSHIDRAILALAGTLQTLQSFDVLIIAEADILQVGLQVKNSTGSTFVPNLGETHADIVNLNFGKLGLFADEMRKKLEISEYTRVTQKSLKDRILKAISDGDIPLEGLPPKIKEQLKL